jgi:thiol:disulfide interchange protein DsbD
MTKVLVTVLLLIVLVTGLAWAGSGEKGASRPRNSADVVTVAPVPAQLTGAAGERIAFQLNVHIADKWHLYAHTDTMFIGIDLQAPEDFPLTDFQVEYPEGHEGVFFGEKVLMHEGDEVVKASATVPAGMAQGEHPLELAFTVQACDDKSCLAPTDIPVNLKLMVK